MSVWDQERRWRLREATKAPYRGLRQFIYLAFGLSGAIGALVFATDLLSGQGDVRTGVNLLLQLGLVAAMGTLWRWERRHRQRHWLR
ncbi:MAG: DUF3493 domain-containing protein [Gloeomargarita sp. SKYBB_i_bin120]|nr:DUF3493 domain-containing protein [Gloeomargarita sp. SKYG98]MCS7293178.1 DUF3493 domain-containing protein [Gloeomargarita sp. SKYB120]MDW8178743.1 DUF3493 domain-containing protein [Gloeomargarita sp. SKYBB_i_bin120]